MGGTNAGVAPYAGYYTAPRQSPVRGTSPGSVSRPAEPETELGSIRTNANIYQLGQSATGPRGSGNSL